MITNTNAVLHSDYRPGREQYPALPAMWRDNRIGEDVAYFYHHDAHGRLTEKDERQIRDG
ncbi:TPA_asm: hypothetical protein GND90_004580, partial [Salmonella enterica subsp. houtenae serovar 1,40:z4,z32:-]|nr:hypothetical protein [Salmonella enterica subsp. houtenae serovar 1,40:z4,z32:-]